MSRSTHPSALRPLAAAGILLAIGLGAPAAARGQTSISDRALLNRVAVPSGAAAARAFRNAAANPEAVVLVSGERALLARTAPAPSGGFVVAATDAFAPARVDGARALLGRWAAWEARLPVVSVQP